MAIIIKDTTATAQEGAEKLYKDALVSDGTLMLIDLSNKAGTNNFNINNGSTIYNLANDTNLVPINGRVDTLKNLKLTTGKGFATDSSDESGAINNANQQKGLFFPDEVNTYLKNNGDNTLHIFWVRRRATPVSNQNALIRSVLGTNVNYNFRMNIGTTNAITFFIGGFDCSTQPQITGTLTQLGIHYKDSTTLPDIYINGAKVSNAITKKSSQVGFMEGVKTCIGNFESVLATSNIFYRSIIEDLKISNRTPEEVVVKDYNYVNGIGEFSSLPTKRPFVDNE